MTLKENVNYNEFLNSVLEFIQELIEGIKAAFDGIKVTKNFENSEYLPN